MKKDSIDYIDDRTITSMIIKEMNEAPEGVQHPKPSDELSEMYLDIMYNILKKPNFSGYYEEVKESMISKAQILFLTNWYKFKPYRVRNNFKIDRTDKIITRNLDKGTNVFYVNCKLEPYQLLVINNRSFTIKEVDEIEDGYKITLFNKLKDSISTDDEVQILYPKMKFNEVSDDVQGGFSFLSLFVFTAFRDEITAAKQRKDKMQKYLEEKESLSGSKNNQFYEEYI